MEEVAQLSQRKHGYGQLDSRESPQHQDVGESLAMFLPNVPPVDIAVLKLQIRKCQHTNVLYHRPQSNGLRRRSGMNFQLGTGKKIINVGQGLNQRRSDKSLRCDEMQRLWQLPLELLERREYSSAEGRTDSASAFLSDRKHREHKAPSSKSSKISSKRKPCLGSECL